MSIASIYNVVDTLFLWYLARPERPVLIGDLRLISNLRGVSLRYSADWLQRGFALSENLPLIDMEHLPREKDVASGAIDDARPDRWGERVIRHIVRPPRLSLLEMLFFAGDDRFGALGVSTSREAYLPCDRGPIPSLRDVDTLHSLIRRVLAGEPIADEASRRLIAPGATMGGARPKALVEIEGAPWVLKFAEPGFASEPLVEHASMTLASKADIRVAETRPVEFANGVAIAIKRFDRGEPTESGQQLRVHALSANVALKAAGAELSYPDLAQLLRRRGDDKVSRHQMQELFRRLVFNILIDNTDDHEKNHVLLVSDSQHLLLSPAFDVVPTAQALGYQAMTVGKEGAASSIENAMSMSNAFGLDPAAALHEAKRVAAVVDDWQSHFATAGVDKNVIESLSRQIDRAYLREQRTALVR